MIRRGQEVQDNVVITQEGILNKDKNFYLTKRLVDRFDGLYLWFNLTETEAQEFRNDGLTPCILFGGTRLNHDADYRDYCSRLQNWIYTSNFVILFSIWYRNKDTILHSIQGIAHKPGIVFVPVSIFQNWRDLSLYDAHKYPYKYLPTANLTPLLVTALFNIFTNLIATIVITAACQVIHVYLS
jgi:hypothetical protein